MTIQDILHKVDHTILKPDATWQEVQTLCDEAVWGKVASVCVAPCFIAQVAQYLKGSIPVCTVIGFPHGNSTTASKVFETQDAILQGADEIDMVISIGLVKEQQWDAVLDDIVKVRKACEGKILKVIIETCLLTQEENIKLCEIVSKAKADYIKTSTGFSTAGAKLEDIHVFREHLQEGVKIKAAGGIRDFETARSFAESGADRLGSSALISLAKKLMENA